MPPKYFQKEIKKNCPKKDIYKHRGTFYFGDYSDDDDYDYYNDYDSYDCRESLEDSHPNPEEFFLECSSCANLAKLLYELETKLKIKNEYRSKVYKCKSRSFVFISTSEFWRSCEVRSSFLTAFLKTVATSKPKQRFKSVFDASYFRDTKEATERFLSGYTMFESGGPYRTGWVDIFCDIPSLVVPSKKSDRRFFRR